MEISRDTEIERLKTAQLKAAYDKIEETKNELVDSIRYAERIQNAVLTRDQKQELIEEKNKKIESFTPRKGKKHTLT